MPYLIMDWIDGISLQVKVREQGRMFFRDAIPVFQQVAAALAYAHKNSVIHRDIKPENIMLGPDDMGNLQVRMVDFGIAKGIGDAENSPETQGFTKTGMVVGTPLYMSPEQVTAGPVDVRTDIYSLGCVMYFTLTGNPPFTGESTVEIFTKHMNSEVPVIDRALKIPQDLKRIILKSMEKNPADRYQSMELLALDLKKVTKGVAIKRHFLASERRTLLHTSLIIMCFILGFVAFYNLSLWIQSTGHQPNIGEASRKDILPTKPQAN
jgi:serine/threonine-protein kinase